MRADPPDQAFRLAADRVPGAGDAHQRGGVDEAAAGPGDRGQPLVGGARRGQEHPVQPVFVGGLQPRAGLLGREVGRDQARAARRGQVAGERAHAVPLDRVPVGHDQDGDARRGDGLDGAQHVGDPGSRGQRAVHGLGDHRAVHQRVGVGQADLDDVGPRRGHGPGGLDRTLDGGEPGGQVADQGGAVVGVRLAEGVGDRGHIAEPLRGGVHVLVAAAGQVDHDEAVRAEFTAHVAGRRPARGPTRWPG